MIRLTLPLVACCLVAAAPMVRSVAAPPTGQATLNAVAFQPLPDTQPISVSVLDDSDANLAVKAALEAALRRAGRTVAAKDAPLVLTIDTSDRTGAWTTPPDTSRIPVTEDQRRLFPKGELGISRLARLPLPSTTVVTPAQYRLMLTLDSTRDGVRLWQGWSIAELAQGEPAELAAAMVPKLAASIGRTVREEMFDLQ